MALRLSRSEAQALGISLPAPRRKFRNEPAELDGHKFDSRGERDRYAHLKLELLAGTIKDLRLQVRFDLDVNGQRIAGYVADFVYVRDGQTVVEDFKGFETPAFRLKEKLMRAIHGVVIFKPRAQSSSRKRRRR